MFARITVPAKTALCIMLLTAELVRPASADQTVYDDALAGDWQNWSWSTTSDFAATAQVHAGTHSLSARHDSGYGGLYLNSTAAVPASSAPTVRFWLHGGATAGQQVQFHIYSAPGVSAGNVPITATSSWTLHEIPLSDVGSPAQVSGLVWQDATGGAQAVFFLDDIELISPSGGDEGTPGVGPALSVDVGADRHPISEDIYGMSYCAEALAAELRLPVNRWGGNATTRYNWQNDTSNRASDWYFQNIAVDHPNPAVLPDDSSADRFVEANRRTGTKAVITVPMIGWTPKSRTKTWGYSITKYGPQTGNDWEWEPDAGNGVSTAAGNPRITNNDPEDTSVAIGPQFVKDWIAHLQSRYGLAPTSGSVQLYSLDNEPMLWSDTHRDVRKTRLGYDELRDLTYTYAAAVKEQEPQAKTLGPCFWGWTAYFWSDLDQEPGGSWWNNPLDRLAHSNTPLAAWYLQQMKTYEDNNAVRLLDYFDLHYYPQVSGVFSTDLGSTAVQSARLQATRSLWDPTYNDGSWIGQPVNLIPRMKEWVADNYPGTKTCVSEYNFGALGHMNGALAQADALGIFGREELDMAMLWTAPATGEPAAYTFRMYRNYDGTGKCFGNTSVRSVSGDHNQLSVYAAQRSKDDAVTVMVVNKAASDLSTTVTLANFSPGSEAEIYRYAPANLEAIIRQPNVVIAAEERVPDVTFPAQSITLIVVPSSNPTPVTVSRFGVE